MRKNSLKAERKDKKNGGRKVSKTRRSRKIGGGDNAVKALMMVLPEEDNYERMANNSNDYDAFVESQEEAATKLNGEMESFFIELCNRVKSGKMRTMDLESGVSMTATYVFFDKKGNLVVANER